MTTTFAPGPTPNTVRAADGRILTAPEGWILLPPGDAALTRRVKEAGDHWVVAEKKGRKVFSQGRVGTGSDHRTDSCRTAMPSDPRRATQRRKEADARRREKAQAEYVEVFFSAAVGFIAQVLASQSKPLTRNFLSRLSIGSLCKAGGLLVRFLCNALETVFKRGKCRSGFLGPPCILEQSHQPQPHASGLEAAAHLVGKVVVNCEHGSVSFRDASDVAGTLRSP